MVETTQTWDFGTAGDYTYDDTKIVVADNTAKLIAAYDTNNPSIYPTDTINIDFLVKFTPTETITGSDAIKYIFVVNGTNYYYTGGAWVASDGTYDQANSSSELTQSVVTSFTLYSQATFTVKAFLHSADGSTTPTLGSMVLTYESCATYMTNDRWAQKRGYTNFENFISIEDFPTARGLAYAREDLFGNIQDFIDGTPDSQDLKYLAGLEDRTINLWIDSEEGRANESQRSQYVPSDFLFQRDRDRLYRIGTTRRRVGARR